MAPAERGLRVVTAFNEREPWVEEQIASRFVGISHVFHGYTLTEIYAMEYELWVMLALAYDDHLKNLKKQERDSKTRRPRRR